MSKNESEMAENHVSFTEEGPMFHLESKYATSSWISGADFRSDRSWFLAQAVNDEL